MPQPPPVQTLLYGPPTSTTVHWSGGRTPNKPPSASAQQLECSSNRRQQRTARASHRLPGTEHALLVQGHLPGQHSQNPNIVPPCADMLHTFSPGHSNNGPTLLQLLQQFTDSLSPGPTAAARLRVCAHQHVMSHSSKAPVLQHPKGVHRWRPPDIAANRTFNTKLLARLLVDGIHAGAAVDVNVKASAFNATLPVYLHDPSLALRRLLVQAGSAGTLPRR